MNLKSVNKKILDRKDVFYWQAERRISQADAGEIWKDKHKGIENSQLIQVVNKCLDEDHKCQLIEDVDPNKQENIGSVNSSRIGHLKNGDKVIIRCHPTGVKNGYFYVESLVAQLLIDNNLPSYKTYAIHDCENEHDNAFQVIERINGTNIERFLQTNPKKENDIVYEMGKTMAEIHKIKVAGFGPFNNELAKEGELKGIHKDFYSSLVAGLKFDLKTLVKFNVIDRTLAKSFKKLFSKSNPLICCKQAVLVHNEIVDWNLLTDGKTINGIIDLDECVASDPICDIACYSTFFNIKRLDKFLQGYFSVAEKPENFEDKFQLFRLRYTLCKLTLRTRRYAYERSENMKNMIEIGKQHMQDCVKYFKINN